MIEVPKAWGMAREMHSPLWKSFGNGLTLHCRQQIYNHLFIQCSRGLRRDWQAEARRGRLQRGGWFVTTVKHGTALEALTRRKSRVDFSEIAKPCRPDCLRRIVCRAFF
jgi:hypothetical protein